MKTMVKTLEITEWLRSLPFSRIFIYESCKQIQMFDLGRLTILSNANEYQLMLGVGIQQHAGASQHFLEAKVITYNL